MNIEFYALTGLINGILALVFGIFVYFKNRKSLVNKTCAALTLSTALWGFSYWRWLLADNAELALFWTRILSLGSTMIPLFYFHWIMVLLGLDRKRQKLILAGYLMTAFFILINLTPYFVKTVEPRLFFPFWPIPGIAYHFYLAISYGGMVIYTCYYLIQHFKKQEGFKKEQLRYIIFATIIGFGGGATNFLLWYNLPIAPLGTFLVALYPILFTYSIVKYRLMDVKLVLRNSLVYLTSISTIFLIAIIINYCSLIHLSNLIIQDAINIVILIISITIFPSLKNYYEKIANKYFFSSLYDAQELIKNLSDSLSSTLETKKIYDSISQTLNKFFHVKSLGILMLNKKEKKYQISFNKDFPVDPDLSFARDQTLYNLFIKKNKLIVVEEIKNNPHIKNSQTTLEILKKYNIKILVPLNIKNKTIGLIALGAKESGDMYNTEDIRVLEIMGSQIAIALQNAILYEESLEFGFKLKKEVERATKELRVANDNLKQLDKAKTEFISIASHQLRTPLSGIKGYLSMLADGDFSKLSNKQQEVVEDVFRNTERLIRLVNVFLNVSRIESGRLKLERSNFDLIKLIQESVRELQTDANKKKLLLEFNSNQKEIKINADRDKLQDVILNLIDNAIKYTTQGKISVQAILKNNQVQISVADTGVGIEPAEIKNLFDKFTRGKKIAQINTSGSGLGLFIAKKIIELHHGKIWIESAGKNQGSSFIFEIPLKQ